ncbi:MAG: ribosome biogenesis GTPase Der [Alphaproteobacteria bacterium]|nr:ribosome biogenesis GTPase Der [Alphaproteobacteria bacterium]
MHSNNNAFKVSIIGRTNVGKSTIFNRLARSNQALAFNRPGVTRDAKEKIITVFDKEITIIDSPGMLDYAECNDNSELLNAINEKLDNIIKESNIIIFVIDAIDGITNNDLDIASELRKSSCNKLILAVNKSEGRVKEQAFIDALSLGFDNTISISAEHGQGIDELLNVLYNNIPDDFKLNGNDIVAKDSKKQIVLKIAFVGRPNVGKSTIINQLLGSNKQLAADFPGLTREDAVFDFIYNNKLFKIIDTPGIRRKSKIHDKLEKISVSSTLRSYRHADAVVLVVDASSLECGFIENQDITLASNILRDGKALVVVFNKYDKTPYKKNSQPKFLMQNFERSLSQNKRIPFLFTSAINNDNLDIMMNTVIETYNKYKIKISTSKLNNWLQFINKTEIMTSANVKFKLKYITQIGETPPTFIIFTYKRQEMRKDQERYIVNHFKQHFNLQDVGVKIIFKNQSRYNKNA